MLFGCTDAVTVNGCEAQQTGVLQFSKKPIINYMELLLYTLCSSGVCVPHIRGKRKTPTQVPK